MAHNKRENDKMFGTSPLKPSYVSQKSAWAQDVPKDTIVVEHRRPSGNEQAQNATPPLMRKTVQTKSAGAQAVTKDTIMVDHHRASGNERPGSEIPPLTAIIQTQRPRSQSPLKWWTLKSVVDNTNSKVKTSTANVNSADNTTATSTTSAGLGVGDNLKEWASKLPETVRELCGHGGSDMARPDQLEQVNELKKILNNTIDRMAIDIQFVFDKAALARQAGSK